MNKVTLMGRLTRDPELRSTATGTSVVSFTLAVDRRFANREGERQADFINCVAWRQTGEFISKYFPKGRMIAVCGSIQTRTWDDQEGKKHYVTEVVVDEAYFAGSAPGQGGTSVPNTANAPVNPRPAAPPIQDFSSIEGFAPFDDGSEDDLPF
jgi:single-strand DNA-binding protein